MRYAISKSFLATFLVIAALVPATASAQEVCNAFVSFKGLVEPTPVVEEGDTVILRAEIGAGLLADGVLLEMNGFGFGFDCGGNIDMDMLTECEPIGHEVIWEGVAATTCTTGDGEPAFQVLESNSVVGVPVKEGKTMVFASGDTCTVDLQFQVKTVSAETNWINQAVGLPYENFTGDCTNGLTANALSTRTYWIDSEPPPEPAIDVTKEISIDDGETWIDDTAGPVEAPSGAMYRITVTNTGDVDLEDVVVEDDMISDDPFEIGDLAVGETVVITPYEDEDSDMEWAYLDMDLVCESRGSYENWVTATGSYDGDDYTDTDDATLECEGVPMIALMKEVSLNGGDDWYDAEIPQSDLDDPLPWSNVDDGVDAIYRLTVGNIGNLTLEDVVINDETLGIENYLVGDLDPGDVVYIDNGDIADLVWEDICSSDGYKTNVAYATGTATDGEDDTDSDAATVDCIGEPAIRVVKEISLDGESWSSSATAFAPASALYRLTVTNIGTMDLENVMVNDELLGVVNYAVKAGEDDEGELAAGETYVITSGELEAIEGYTPVSCDTTETIDNTALTEGFYPFEDDFARVWDDDSALLNCTETADICPVFARPANLWFEYSFQTGNSNHQDEAYADPDDVLPADFPELAAIEIYDSKGVKGTPGKPAEPYTTVYVVKGGVFGVLGEWSKEGKVFPNITFRIYPADFIDDPDYVENGLVQEIFLHGSCSLPLVMGDQFGGTTLVGFDKFVNEKDNGKPVK